MTSRPPTPTSPRPPQRWAPVLCLLSLLLVAAVVQAAPAPAAAPPESRPCAVRGEEPKPQARPAAGGEASDAATGETKPGAAGGSAHRARSGFRWHSFLPGMFK